MLPPVENITVSTHKSFGPNVKAERPQSRHADGLSGAARVRLSVKMKMPSYVNTGSGTSNTPLLLQNHKHVILYITTSH